MQTPLAPTVMSAQPTVVLGSPIVAEGLRSIGCDVVAATGFPMQLASVVMRFRPTLVVVYTDARDVPGLMGCLQDVRVKLRSTRIVVLLPLTVDQQVVHELAARGFEVASDANDATALRLLLGVGFAAPTLLTRREVEVLELAAHGLTNQAIGRRLGLQLNTVKNYLRSVHRKLGARSRTEAVMIAARAGYPVLPIR